MMRFDKFSERAQDAAARAAEIITRYGHNQVDSEHILLALIEQPDGIVSQIFEMLKVDTMLWLTGLMKYCARHPRRISLAGRVGKFS